MFIAANLARNQLKMSMISGMLKRQSWTNAGEGLVMESNDRSEPKVQSLEGQHSASHTAGHAAGRGRWPCLPYILQQWCLYNWLFTAKNKYTCMCAGGIWTRNNKAEVPSCISCIFIPQSLMGLVHFPDYQYLKTYVLFLAFFLILPSYYTKIPLQTCLQDSWSSKGTF